MERKSQEAHPLQLFINVDGRALVVEHDGTVWAWDAIAQHYTLGHSLPDTVLAEARRLAALVRAGTHRIVAGHVFEEVQS